MQKFSLALAAILFVANGSPAQDVKQVVFVNQATYDGKGIPATYVPLVEAIKADYPKATFTFSDGKLLVGVNLPGEAGEILNINWQSDCPVNSQFQFQQKNPILTKVVKPLLVAWTKARHPGFEGASVKDYRQTGTWAEVVLNQPDKRVSRR